MRHAAPAVGVHFTTAYDWQNRGDALIAEAKQTRPHIEAELADWLLNFEDNFADDNAMWDSPPPMPFLEEDWPYVLFAIGMRKAKAQATVDALTGIIDAGKKDWKAYAWYLERTAPDEFGRKQSIQHSGPDGGPMEIATVDPGVLLEKLRELRIRNEGKE